MRMRKKGGQENEQETIDFNVFVPVSPPNYKKQSYPYAVTASKRSHELPTIALDNDFSQSSFTEEVYEDAQYISASLASPVSEDNKEEGRTSISKSTIFGGILLSCVFIAASFFAGRMTTPPSSAITFSDEFLRSQEWLLLQLSKTHAVPEHETEFSRHLSLLVDEMKLKSDALKESKEKLTLAEQQANEAWGEYQLKTTQLESIDKLRQEDMRKLLRTTALERFGKGPHYVEFVVRVPGAGTRTHLETMYFTMEVADIEVMPASVYVFLEQINQGLWDNTSFQINAPHTLTAQPLSIDGSNAKETAMAAAGLQHVPVREYSDRFKHEEYTIGLSTDTASRPGPDFYINKMDNSDIHEGMPCIGRIIIGLQTIDRITAIHSPDGSPYLPKPVEIQSVRHLSALEDAVGGLAYSNVVKKIESGKDF